jgi:hypothetical protein
MTTTTTHDVVARRFRQDVERSLALLQARLHHGHRLTALEVYLEDLNTVIGTIAFLPELLPSVQLYNDVDQYDGLLLLEFLERHHEKYHLPTMNNLEEWRRCVARWNQTVLKMLTGSAMLTEHDIEQLQRLTDALDDFAATPFEAFHPETVFARITTTRTSTA